MKISFCVLDWQRWHFNCHCKWCLMYQYPIWMCSVNILVFQKCNKYFYINATVGNFFFFLGLHLCFYFFFPFIFISWRLITLQYCSGFCHTLTWISHGFTCIPHPDPPSHFPLNFLNISFNFNILWIFFVASAQLYHIWITPIHFFPSSPYKVIFSYLIALGIFFNTKLKNCAVIFMLPMILNRALLKFQHKNYFPVGYFY